MNSVLSRVGSWSCPPTAQRPGDLKEETGYKSPFFLSTVEFQVTSETQTLNPLLGSSVSLRCSFSMAPGLNLTGVEWRLQHKGSGQLVYSWKTGQGQAKRKGATLEPEELLRAGNASLTLPNLTLKDEGSYICQISTSLYQAQQIIPLSILGKVRPWFFWDKEEGGAYGNVSQTRILTQREFPERRNVFPQPRHSGGLDGIRSEVSLNTKIIPPRNN